MTREEAHELIDQLFDKAGGVQTNLEFVPGRPLVAVPDETAPKRQLPEGQRVVRTKTSGDRVYMIDEIKKTRQWVTNPDVLKGLGFEIGDVVEIEDNELLKYQTGPALYKVPENDT